MICFSASNKNDMFLKKFAKKKWAKNVFQYVTMVAKMLHVYNSVRVPDRPILAIICS